MNPQYDPDRHHRRSVRMRGWDYAGAATYFLTLCTHRRVCLFGDVVAGEMTLSARGKIADQCWRAIPAHFPNARLDAFVVMPNHVHGIVVITRRGDDHAVQSSPASDVGARQRAQHAAPLQHGAGSHTGVVTQGKHVAAGSLGAIVRSFKAAATRQINRMRGSPGSPVWQRNYWEHVVRDEAELERIRTYIVSNPALWAEDKLYVTGEGGLDFD